MPRATPTEDLELIESIVTAHADGIRIVDLEAELSQHRGTTLNRRTLQRRLQKLIDQQRLTTAGESVALVYRAAAGARTYHPSRPATALAASGGEFMRNHPRQVDRLRQREGRLNRPAASGL